MESTCDNNKLGILNYIITYEIIDISNLPKIIDYVETTNFIEGEKQSINEVIDKRICILAVKEDIPSHFRNINGLYGTYAAIQFFYMSDPTQIRYRLNTGSEVLRDKLKQFQNQLAFPAVGIIRKVGRYYTFG